MTASTINAAFGTANDCQTIAFTATSAVDLFVIDCAGRDRVSVHVSSPGVGTTISYEVSNENGASTTWQAIGGYAPATPATETVTTSNAASLLVFRLDCKFFRARVSTYGSGTVSGTAQLTSIYAS